MSRIFTGLYYYLICPTSISPIFPFINGIKVETTYLGKKISELMFGGFFYNNLICLLSLFINKFKSYFKEKNIYFIAIISLIFGFIVVIVDTEMAGILPRYYSDFSWLFLLSSLIILCALNEKYKDKISFRKVVLFFIIISLIYNFNFIFVDTELSIVDEMPLLLEKLRSLIIFWR